MPAYLIVTREGPVEDAEEMAAYQAKTRTMGGDIRPTPLVVYGKIESLEGTPPEGMVMLQFADAAEARAWYESPGYQDALPHRIRSGKWRAVIVDGFSMPA